MLCRALLVALVGLASWAKHDGPDVAMERQAAGSAAVADTAHGPEDSAQRWEALRRASVPLPQSHWTSPHATAGAAWPERAQGNQRHHAYVPRSPDRVLPRLDCIPLLI